MVNSFVVDVWMSLKRLCVVLNIGASVLFSLGNFLEILENPWAATSQSYKVWKTWAATSQSMTWKNIIYEN